MKKIKIGRNILTVIDEDEFNRRVTTKPELISTLASDTAVVKEGMVYPVLNQYSPHVPGVCNIGPVSIYTKPSEPDPEYYEDNIIDFENNTGLQDVIRKQARLAEAERTILVSADNIWQPKITENDTPEMKLLKTAIIKKAIDIIPYKPRFGSNFNNDSRLFEGNSITLPKLTKMCNIFDIKATLILEDKKGAPNPIGDKLVAVITSNDEE